MENEGVLMTIGQAAERGGASVDTVRYYEKLGLLAKPERSAGGFRLYSKEDVERLRFIKKAQSFGLTLSEIRGIIGRSREGLDQCCRHLNSLLARKLEEIERQMRELKAMKKGLKSLLSGWIPLREARKKKYAVCPQIEAAPQRKGGKKNVQKKS
jgi:DNA-binding transcriptional MerR regulator